MTVYTPLSEMKGELPKIPLRSMQKAGFHTMHDLLWHVPREYIDVEPWHPTHADGDEVVINGRVAEAEVTEKQINDTRVTYVPAAARGSSVT